MESFYCYNIYVLQQLNALKCRWPLTWHQYRQAIKRWTSTPAQNWCFWRKCDGKCLKEHYWAPRFQNYLGVCSPRPLQRLAPSALKTCLALFSSLATALPLELSIWEIFRLILGQINSNLSKIKKAFATWQHAFLSTGTSLRSGYHWKDPPAEVEYRWWQFWSKMMKSEVAQRPGACFSKAPETFWVRKAIAKSQTLRLQSCFIHLFPSYKKFQTYRLLCF